jgi:hypothetical protein
VNKYWQNYIVEGILSIDEEYKMNDVIIDGLVVSIFTDDGPEPLINLTQFDEIITHKLAIVGITILSMGINTVDLRDQRKFNLLGPIPVPDSTDFNTLSIFFNVNPDLGTIDERFKKFGRQCNLWIIFKTENREKILSQYKVIEKTLTDVLEKIENESELNEDLFKSLLQSLQKVHTPQEIESFVNKDKPSQITSELLDYGFFTTNEEENVLPVNDLKNVNELNSLIQVDMKNKIIYVLKVKPDIPQREIFIAGRAASQLNLEKFKSEFSIEKINDKIVVDFHINRIISLVEKIS